MTTPKDKTPGELLAEKEYPDNPLRSFHINDQRAAFAKGFAAGQAARPAHPSQTDEELYKQAMDDVTPEALERMDKRLAAIDAQTEDLEKRAREFLADAKSFAALHAGTAGYGKMQRSIQRFQDSLSAPKAVETVPCPHLVNGSCPLHNLHCQYPKCTQPRTR